MSFFKAYDMRGTYGVDFDLDTVYKIGLALPQRLAAKNWLIGRDCRETSPLMRDALVSGLVSAGCKVTDIGLVTTPMVYHFTAEDGYDASVMITASHNPPSDNGMKVSKAGALPVGYADGLADVEKMISGPDFAKGSSRPSSAPAVETKDVLARYIEWQKARVWPGEYSLLRFAVDCSNGMASLFAHEMFPGAVVINDTLDGTFPCHAPNPLKAEAREQLAKTVRENGLDCGVIFDGDADRAMFVDERGEFIQPDYLIPIVFSAMPDIGIEKRVVLHDVRTSRGAIERLTAMHAHPFMVPVGHAFAKPAMREHSAICGGELAGHYYFSDFHNCDSGLLAATRVLKVFANAKREGLKVSRLMLPISAPWANSGERNFKVEDKDAAIERVLECAAKLARETSRSTIDGVRLEFDEGWINVRKSNTEPYLRLIVECDSKARLDDWLAQLEGAIGI